jgi:hypothetical protein
VNRGSHGTALTRNTARKRCNSQPASPKRDPLLLPRRSRSGTLALGKWSRLGPHRRRLLVALFDTLVQDLGCGRETRSEFMTVVRRRGGYRIRVRLLDPGEAGRQTPLLGTSEYRVNWSIGGSDPESQTGGPIFLDSPSLAPGEEGTAVLVPLWREAGGWQAVDVATALTGFERAREVARAVVTDVLPADPR